MVREEEEPKHVPMGMAQLAAIAIKKATKYKFTITMLGGLMMIKL